MNEREQEQERDPGTDELLEEQVGKGYGDDEGERDDALEHETSSGE
jgi:hypothetical protein